MGLRYERHRPETWPVRQQAELLSTQQRESLERDGYLLVPSLLDETVLGPIASRLEDLVRMTVAAWDADPSPAIVEPGVVRAKLDRADPDFAPCCEHPLLSDAAASVLGPTWYLAALSLRAPLPGCGHQGLHPDFEERRITEPWQTLSAMWCITAFTPDNGPLRVIPGSHRVREPAHRHAGVRIGDGPAPGRGEDRRARRVGDLVQQRRPVALRHPQRPCAATGGDRGLRYGQPILLICASPDASNKGRPAAWKACLRSGSACQSAGQPVCRAVRE